MPKILLSVPHRKQLNDADCLAACAAMVLDYLNHPIEYPRLLKLLNIHSYGAPASNIRRLESLNINVDYRVTDLAGLMSLLDQAKPIIVFVRTGDLPHWGYGTDHALVAVGYDDANIYVNDPAFPDAPVPVPRGDFELAWLERDYYYALITR